MLRSLPIEVIGLYPGKAPSVTSMPNFAIFYFHFFSGTKTSYMNTLRFFKTNKTVKTVKIVAHISKTLLSACTEKETL